MVGWVTLGKLWYHMVLYSTIREIIKYFNFEPNSELFLLNCESNRVFYVFIRFKVPNNIYGKEIT